MEQPRGPAIELAGLSSMYCTTGPLSTTSTQQSLPLDSLSSGLLSRRTNDATAQPPIDRCTCGSATAPSRAEPLQGAQVLIIEEDAATREAADSALGAAGYGVTSVGETARGLRDAVSAKLDLLVLSDTLRVASGHSLIQHLRRAGNSLPALLLTRTHDEERVMAAVAAGADDALQKPFSAAELLLRVDTLLRLFTRRAPSQTNRLLIDDLQLDPAELKSYRAGRDLCLTAKEFSILALLMRSYGEVVSRAAIEAAIWSASSIYRPATLDVYMSRLRRKVDGGAKRKLLHTVRGNGFVLDSTGGDCHE